MNKRFILLAAGIVTGVFLAASARGEYLPPKLDELEEFRAILTNMVQIALPESDFVYIAAREARFTTARQRVADLKLPETLKHRRKDYEQAKSRFLDACERFQDVMASDKYEHIGLRLHRVDTAFAQLSIALGGPPPAVEEFHRAAGPFVADKKRQPKVPPTAGEVAALRHAVENLLATTLGGDYRIVTPQFEQERALAVGAARGLDSTVATQDTVHIRAAMRGVAASSRRLWTIFQPPKD